MMVLFIVGKSLQHGPYFRNLAVGLLIVNFTQKIRPKKKEDAKTHALKLVNGFGEVIESKTKDTVALALCP